MIPEPSTPRATELAPVTPELRKTVEAAFRSYESRLFHSALRITRNEQDAWDAVQEGMVSALRNAERFRGDSAVASWLYSIVVNAALYQRRRAASRRRGLDNFVERVWPEAERSLAAGTRQSDPEAHLLARVELERVSARIAELPESRRALLERTLGGDSFQEIADEIGEPVAAVKSRVWRTRVGLRDEFAGVQAAA